MSAVTIASIVEGEGEVGALCKVLHRIALIEQEWELRTPKSHRVPRSSLVRPGGIENAVRQEAIQVQDRGGVLVVLDADDDLPCKYGPCLLERARKARPDIEIAVVLPKPEFEAWKLIHKPFSVRAGRQSTIHTLWISGEPWTTQRPLPLNRVFSQI